MVVSQLRGSTIVIISAHLPGQHMWASAGPDPSSNSTKQPKLDGCIKNDNSVRARSPLTKSKVGKKGQQYNKCSCQCTDGLRATQNGQHCREFQHPAWIETKSPEYLLLTLTTKPTSVSALQQKHSLYFATCNPCIQDCSSQIVPVEYQGQTRNTRILECKPLINTSYFIWHRLELKYFHLAQFLPNAHWAAHQPWSENW